jgi:hypothetical protein
MAGTYIDVKAARKVAEELLAAKESLYERIEVVRSDLRNAVKMGGVSIEDSEWITETFPESKRVRRTPVEKAKLARELAEKLEKEAKQEKPKAG